MRLLRFMVSGQKVTTDPECDFSKLVAGTTGYLKARFTFSSEWGDCVKFARFWRGGREYAVRLENDECDIPPEALTGITFGVSVLGQSNSYRITTDRILIWQEVSG